MALVLLSVAGGGMASASPSGPSPTLPPFLPRLTLGGSAAPTATAVFYLQEGATMAAENGVASATMPSVSATFVLRSSVYAIGYEINGLSDTGDWYQGLAVDNWPGCPAGFGFAYEVWDNAQNSVVGPICNLPYKVAAGDTLTITISLSCGGAHVGDACFTFRDVTTGAGGTVYVTQPDPTATAFVNVDTGASANGYFTGPMTEVVDVAASSCSVYGSMPTVDYRIGVGGAYVTSYTPWSDEFSVVGSSVSVCYSDVGGVTGSAGDPVTVYYESAALNGYGPHLLAGQNFTAAGGPAGTFRFQTDPVRFSVFVSVSPAAIDLGENATVSATPSGNSGPLSCAWAVNGTPTAETRCTWTSTPTSLGSFEFLALANDSLQDYASGTALLTVYSGPLVPAPLVSKAVIDLGQNVTWVSTASGGSGTLTYAWNGLPPGCAGSGRTFTCRPTATGIYAATVVVTDANGLAVTSNATTLTVNPALEPSAVATPNAVLQGQAVTFTAGAKGGTPPIVLAWSGLPSGCSAPADAANFSCAPSVTGVFMVTLRASDGAGMTAYDTLVLTVGSAIFGMPAAQGAAMIGVTLVLAAVFGVGILLLVRRSRKGQAPAPPPPMPPPPPPPPPGF